MNNSVIERKELSFPTISKDSCFSSKKITVSTRQNTLKNQIIKNFFLPTENYEKPRFSGSRSPVLKSTNTKPKINERRLHEIDVDLDNKEMTFQELKDIDISALETIFFSYVDYLEDLTQIISHHTYIYKPHLTRAKNGFISLFRKFFPMLKRVVASTSEKISQTQLTINPTKTSMILSNLGEIISNEIVGIHKIENYIKKKFLDRKKGKINSTGTQTDYKTNEDGMIEYDFKSYEELQNEISLLKNQNIILLQEQKAIYESGRIEDDIDKVINRNKVLESMIIEMRNSFELRKMT